MAKNNTPEVKTEQKVQTKYDRKMEARRQQKLKDERQAKITKIIVALIVIVIAAAIVISVAGSIIRKYTALNGAYIKVGDQEMTKLEYDYYYETTVNNYLSSMASMLPYIGLDTSKDFADQQYDENMTWKDLFDSMTVEQIRQTKALTDDAQKSGFTYDSTAEYESFVTEFKEAADSSGVSVKEFYKENFGSYATKKNTEPFIREGMLANAYYDELLETNTPSDEDIKAYYEENKQDYDKVDYRSFTFTADVSAEATEEEINAAMDEIGAKAEEMMQARMDGSDFEELCIENSSDEAKEGYEDPETEYSLSEGRYYSGITATVADWLYEDNRQEGDITVLKDEVYNQYYVVEFVRRYYDEADDTNISSTIASQRVSEYLSTLVENYPVTDIKGELKYLTIVDVDTDENTEITEEVPETSESEEEGTSTDESADGNAQ